MENEHSSRNYVDLDHFGGHVFFFCLKGFFYSRQKKSKIGHLFLQFFFIFFIYKKNNAFFSFKFSFRNYEIFCKCVYAE